MKFRVITPLMIIAKTITADSRTTTSISGLQRARNPLFIFDHLRLGTDWAGSMNSARISRLLSCD